MPSRVPKASRTLWIRATTVGVGVSTVEGPYRSTVPIDYHPRVMGRKNKKGQT